MDLLKITDKEVERFDSYFEQTSTVSIEQIAPEVVNDSTEIRINNESINKFDCIYSEIPVKSAVFGRVMLEMIEDFRIPVNYSSTGFFVMAKKNYLYYTLHEQNIPTSKTAVFSTEKASRSIEKHLKGPVIGRKFENLEEIENRKIETVDSIGEFVEGAEYPGDLFIFHEYSEGEKFRCLVIDGNVIPVKDSSDGWRFSEKNLKYSNISDNKKEIVKSAVRKIGTPMAEVLLRGEKIYDVRPNPDLETYTDITGKNAFEKTVDLLKEGAGK